MRGVKLKLYRTLLECSCVKWRCWINWRTWLTVGVVVIYCLMLLVVLPLMIYGLYAVDAETQFSAWFVAGLFVLLTIPIFLANLLQHLVNYTQPHLQAYIVRILWIVPVYSIDSWLGLKFPASAIYWSTVRECYESYALYNFLVYCLNFLENEYSLADELDSRPSVRHPIPCCCCKPWPKGRRFIRWIKVTVLQYAVARPILTVIALITQWAGVYDEGHIRFDKAYVYIAMANALSQALALYSLAYFYKGTKELLKPLKPLLKFASIKAIIFFTFWQAFCISILVRLNVIRQEDGIWKSRGFEDVAISIQDFIICVEMLVASIVFYFVFTHKPYIDPAAAQVPCFQSFVGMMDVRDIYGDVRENFVDPIPIPRISSLPGIRDRVSRKDPSVEDIPLLRVRDRGDSRGYESNEDRHDDVEASMAVLSLRDVSGDNAKAPVGDTTASLDSSSEESNEGSGNTPAHSVVLPIDSDIRERKNNILSSSSNSNSC